MRFDGRLVAPNLTLTDPRDANLIKIQRIKQQVKQQVKHFKFAILNLNSHGLCVFSVAEVKYTCILLKIYSLKIMHVVMTYKIY